MNISGCQTNFPYFLMSSVFADWSFLTWLVFLGTWQQEDSFFCHWPWWRKFTYLAMLSGFWMKGGKQYSILFLSLMAGLYLPGEAFWALTTKQIPLSVSDFLFHFVLGLYLVLLRGLSWLCTQSYSWQAQGLYIDVRDWAQVKTNALSSVLLLLAVMVIPLT